MVDWKNLVARWRWEAALVACIAVSLAVLILSESGSQRLYSGFDSGLRSMWASSRLGELRATIVDAETSQRGYLLTLSEAYLAPYAEALKRIATLQTEIRDYYAEHGGRQASQQFAELGTAIASKLKEMDFTVRMAREGRVADAVEFVRTDLGKFRMEQIRQSIDQLQALERDRTAVLVDEWRDSLGISRVGVAAITALNIALLVLTVRWLKQQWQRGEERAGELDRQVNERTEQLARLSAYLQEVSENEKTHLGRELHDELGAILTATRMDLLWIRARLTPEQSQLLDKLKRAMGNLDQGIAVKRRIIEDLRPSILSNFGLMTAVREIADQTAERLGWELELDLPPTDPDLEEYVEIAMFRILQEALTNASKYAKATRVRVRLSCSEGESASCTLEVEDNGIGFNRRGVRPDAHGLVGMRQRLEPRGGSLVVRTAPGKGTLVQAALPIRERSKEEPTAAADA